MADFFLSSCVQKNNALDAGANNILSSPDTPASDINMDNQDIDSTKYLPSNAIVGQDLNEFPKAILTRAQLKKLILSNNNLTILPVRDR